MVETVGIFVGIAFLFGSLLIGLPVFAALGLSGLVGSLFFVDLGNLLESGHLIWGGLDSFSLLAMPGFVLMGNLYFHHDFGRDHHYDFGRQHLGWDDHFNLGRDCGS